MEAVPYEELRGPPTPVDDNWQRVKPDTSPVVLYLPTGEKYETTQKGKRFAFINSTFDIGVLEFGANSTRATIRAELAAFEKRDLDVAPETQW